MSGCVWFGQSNCCPCILTRNTAQHKMLDNRCCLSSGCFWDLEISSHSWDRLSATMSSENKRSYIQHATNWLGNEFCGNYTLNLELTFFIAPFKGLFTVTLGSKHCCQHQQSNCLKRLSNQRSCSYENTSVEATLVVYSCSLQASYHYTMLGNISRQTVWAISRLSKTCTLHHGAYDQIFSVPSLFFWEGAWVRG